MSYIDSAIQENWQTDTRKAIRGWCSPHTDLFFSAYKNLDLAMLAILMKISGVLATVFSCHTPYQQECEEKI